jgi:hypothetical protein
MTQEQQDAVDLLQEQIANIDKFEAYLAAEETAAGLEPRPDMAWDERMDRLGEAWRAGRATCTPQAHPDGAIPKENAQTAPALATGRTRAGTSAPARG